MTEKKSTDGRQSNAHVIFEEPPSSAVGKSAETVTGVSTKSGAAAGPSVTSGTEAGLSGANGVGTALFGGGGNSSAVVSRGTMNGGEVSPGGSGSEPTSGPGGSPAENILTVSARTGTALRKLLESFETRLNGPVSMADLCFSANTGGEHFPFRFCYAASRPDEFREGIRRFLASDRSGAPPLESPGTAFLFTGEGARAAGMGRSLYERYGVFRSAMDRCSEILEARMGRGLVALLYGGGDGKELHRTFYAQPALFSLGWSLSRLWASWGITPRAVMGHGVGEFTAACTAGVFSLEDGLKLVSARAGLMEDLGGKGGMLEVRASRETAEEVAASVGDGLSFAAFNAPESVVLSGDLRAVETADGRCREMGVRTVKLPASHAFHSPRMQGMIEAFREVAAEVTYGSPRVELISNLDGGSAGERVCDPEYWCRHILNPVDFVAGIGSLEQKGLNLFLELGPGSTLIDLGKQGVKDPGAAIWLASLGPGAGGEHELLSALSELYRRGARIDFQAFHGDRPGGKIPLPNYPFERERYCFPPADVSAGHRLGEAQSRGAPGPGEGAGMFGAEETGAGGQRTRAGQKAGPVAGKADSEDLYHIQWRPKVQFGSAPLWFDREDGPGVKSVSSRVKVPEYAESLPEEMERLGAIYTVEAMEILGVDFTPGSKHDREGFKAGIGIRPLHERLMDRLYAVLEEEGILGKDDSILTKPVFPEASGYLEKLMRENPAALPELELLGRCASSLAEVLTGDLDPLSLLFPPDGGLAGRLPADSPSLGMMNRLLAETLAGLTADLPGSRGVEILEVGGGTGGATAAVLPLLPRDGYRYWFTDLSACFFSGAREKFDRYGGVDYGVLDVEKDPVEQGFAGESFDIVVAANVLHAVRDLADALNRTWTLLAPGGRLLLLEGTSPRRWMDLIFGLTEDWWRYGDLDLRDYPLIGAEKWENLLASCGFTDVVVTAPESGGRALISDQILITARKPAGAPRGTCLVLSRENELAANLTSVMGRQGWDCRVVDLRGADAIAGLPDYFPPSGPVTVVSLRGLGSRGLPEPGQAETYLFERMAEIRAASEFHGEIRYHLATTRRVALEGDGPGLSPLHALAWGLARTAAVELPDRFGGIIDLDPAAPLSDMALAAAAEINTPGEEQVAWRPFGRFVPRLCPLSLEVPGTLGVNPGRSYLITGGSGFLGLRLARWLIDRGARYLCLAGRNAPDREALGALRKKGNRITFVRVDVASGPDMGRLFQSLGETLPPLAGVFHGAGTTEFTHIREMTSDRIAGVLGAKVTGGLLLHRHTRELNLDFFISFSSAAAVWGASGQAHFAAANAFLDALMQWRVKRGLPGRSVNWGLLADKEGENIEGRLPMGKMDALGHAVFRARLLHGGVEPVPPEEGFSAMEALEGAGPLAVVARMDWDRFREIFGRPSPLLKGVLDGGRENASLAREGLRRGKVPAPGAARGDRLMEKVRGTAISALGLPGEKCLELRRGGGRGMDSPVDPDLKTLLEIQLRRKHRRPDPPDNAGAALLHPLVHRRVKVAVEKDALIFESEFSTRIFPWLTEHRVGGRPVVPGAVFIEMAAWAGRERFPGKWTILEGVTFAAPLVLDNAGTVVQMVLTPLEDGFNVGFHGRTPGEDEWRRHAELRLRPGEKMPVEPVDAPGILGTLPEEMDVTACYRDFERRKVDYGPLFRTMASLHRSDRQALGRVRLPAGGYGFHPALLDGCVQIVAAAFVGRERGSLLPAGMETVRIMGTAQEDLWCRATLAGEPAGGVLRSDLTLFDQGGAVVMDIRGLTLGKKRGGRENATWKDLLHEVHWRPDEGIALPVIFPRPFILYSDPGAVVDRAERDADGGENIPPAPPVKQGPGEGLVDLFEDLAFEYAVDAFHKLGLGFSGGEIVVPGELRNRGGIGKGREPLFDRLVSELKKRGYLAEVKPTESRGVSGTRESNAENEPIESRGVSGTGESNAENEPRNNGGALRGIAPLPPVYPGKTHRELLGRFPGSRIELTMLHRCGAALPEVLAGKTDPLELLFAEGVEVDAASLYADTLGARIMYRKLGEAASALLKSLAPGESLRVLEVGGGVGSATAALVPLLPGERTTYYFTDISEGVVSAAEKRFAQAPFMKFGVLDLEKDPGVQGFGDAGFHLIVAANVLHAVKDVDRAMAHIAGLLAPGGVLLALEAVRGRLWGDLIMGMTAGWWRFDDDYRGDHPLLPVPVWEKLLVKHGFEPPGVTAAGGESVRLLSDMTLIAAGKRVPEKGRWLLFTDTHGPGARLESAIFDEGSAVRVVRGIDYRKVSENRYEVHAHKPEHLARALADAGVEKLRGVIHLWSLQDPVTGSLPNFMSLLELSCGGILTLIKTHLAGVVEISRLIIVTRNAVPAAGAEVTREGLVGSALHGLTGVVREEHPEISAGIVDLGWDEAEGSRVLRGLLIAEPRARMAVRCGRFFSPVLRRSPPVSTSSRTFHGDGVYIIVGGLGGIGILVARRFLAKGAGRLILTGRTPENQEIRERVDALRGEAPDARVDYLAEDPVRSTRGLKALLEEGDGRLRGVVNCAGEFDDRRLGDHGWPLFRKVLLAKVVGTWHIHLLTEDMPLDFFIVNASVSSLAGAAGMGSHVAANAFLDGFCRYRRSLGLPGLAVHWGLWKGGAEATVPEERGSAQYAARGVRGMAPEAALDALEYLAGLDLPLAVVAHMDRETFSSHFSVEGPELSAAPADLAAPGISGEAGELPVALPAGRRIR